VGLGVRSWLFSLAIVDWHADRSELVALCDSNPGRLRHRADFARSKGVEVGAYPRGEFERMIRERRPDCVVVTSPDHTHDVYVCRALELGCDVVTEKPMTIDAERCQRILDTVERTGRSCRVTFNYRYAPPRMQVKELLDAGTIGDILSVDFHWLLDTTHGADYFRRWHRRRENSGGLLVHKATHHFDLVNWWLGTVPRRVFASGARRFYRPERADAYGLAQRAERCLGCPEASRCAFHLDLRERKELAAIYLEHESHDGYWRDACVFSPEIDIEDSVAASVEYRSGARLAYSLNAFMPWEGYTVAFNGTRGRLEHKCEESVYVSGDGSVPGQLRPEGTWIRVFPHFAPAYEVELWQAEGAHGGGDLPLAKDVFAPEDEPDRFGRAADHRAGAWSLLTGIAANRSIASGQPVDVDTLVRGLGLPDGVEDAADPSRSAC
jgi:predicted dehydrogenase